MRILEVINKRCARVILGVNSFTPSDQMFRQLKWQSLKERCNYFTALMVFKCLNGLSPTYLQINLSTCATITGAIQGNPQRAYYHYPQL